MITGIWKEAAIVNVSEVGICVEGVASEEGVIVTCGRVQTEVAGETRLISVRENDQPLLK